MADRTRLRRWLPIIGWAALISLFSTHWFASEETGRLLLPLLHRLFPGLPPVTLYAIHKSVRKLGHLSEYFVLSLLVGRTLREEGWTKVGAACGAILVAAGYAALDELHQAFVPNRTASVGDVGIDMLGAVAAQLLLLAGPGRRHHRIRGLATLPASGSLPGEPGIADPPTR